VSNNVGLPTGASAVVAGKYQTIDFAYSGATQYIGRNVFNYFVVIIASVKYYLAGALIHSWNIDSNSGTEADTVGGLIAIGYLRYGLFLLKKLAIKPPRPLNEFHKVGFFHHWLLVLDLLLGLAQSAFDRKDLYGDQVMIPLDRHGIGR
jgi:hypothetical protein